MNEYEAGLNVYVPDYYLDFKCINRLCCHSCCIGWEIDIDPESLRRYRRADGALGEKLRESIAENGDGASFILGEDERCPFLNGEGLCELILEWGEDSLCEICTDHPRYRNYLSDTRLEMGLGLCCEEAARMVVCKESVTCLVPIQEDAALPADEEEKNFLSARASVLSLVQNRSLPLAERLDAVFAFLNIKLPELTGKEWKEFLLSLERLDPEWEKTVCALESGDFCGLPEGFDIPLEQLAVYFILRHTPESVYDGRFAERTAFSLLSVKLIAAIFAQGRKSLEALADIARAYSAEIEYSDENTEAFLSLIEGEN